MLLPLKNYLVFQSSHIDMINQAKISDINSIYNDSITEENYKIITSAAKSALNQPIPAECQKNENLKDINTWCFLKLDYIIGNGINITGFNVQVYMGVGTEHFYYSFDYSQYFIFALGEITFMINLIKI